MGMFDTVTLICPKCGEVTEEQSKYGECSLLNYNLGNAPLLVIADLNTNSIYCQYCEAHLKVDVRFVASVRVAEDDPEDEELRCV